jgi:ribulose-phosphate 3-epimerase
VAPFVAAVRAHGKRVGLAVKPGTPLEALETHLPHIDLALCMTVEPGFGGQAFLRETLPRIAQLRAAISARNPPCDLEVDGGVHAGTAGACLTAGANVLVVGTGIFRHPQGIAAAVASLRLLG